VSYLLHSATSSVGSQCRRTSGCRAWRKDRRNCRLSDPTGEQASVAVYYYSSLPSIIHRFVVYAGAALLHHENVFIGWLISIQTDESKHNQTFFNFDVSVSARDLPPKKFDYFLQYHIYAFNYHYIIYMLLIVIFGASCPWLTEILHLYCR